MAASAVRTERLGGAPLVRPSRFRPSTPWFSSGVGFWDSRRTRISVIVHKLRFWFLIVWYKVSFKENSSSLVHGLRRQRLLWELF